MDLATRILEEQKQKKKEAVTELCHLSWLSDENCAKQYPSMFDSIDLLGQTLILAPESQPKEYPAD
jgi:hypothetical protein